MDKAFATRAERPCLDLQNPYQAEDGRAHPGAPMLSWEVERKIPECHGTVGLLYSKMNKVVLLQGN